MRASTGTPLARKGHDRTGVGTLRCPHSLALALVDVRAGERFSLSHASVAHLRRQGAQLERLIYDVGDARFKASSDHPDRLALLLGELLCSVPAMHMRMHDLVCQILYGVTTVCGLGLRNSELCEQENRRMGKVRSWPPAAVLRRPRTIRLAIRVFTACVRRVYIPIRGSSVRPQPR